MARDSKMFGTWYVSYGQYRYYYVLLASGQVQWRDYSDPTEAGTGTWDKVGNTVTFDWSPSSTKENWTVNAACVSTTGGSVVANYGTFRNLLAIKQYTVDETDENTKGLMEEWIAAYRSGTPWASPHACPWAIPYTYFTNMRLAAKCIGGPIQKIRGLAIHTTAGNESRSVKVALENGILNVWNGNGASAHFYIGNLGELVQIVPLNRIANAQRDPANRYYISVEVENAGKGPMKQVQLGTAKLLFNWIANKYGVPKQLATGYVGPYAVGSEKTFGPDAKRIFDPITRELCGPDGVTKDQATASAAYGLSCHYWLKGEKPCPGVGMLRQLPSIL